MYFTVSLGFGLVLVLISCVILFCCKFVLPPSEYMVSVKFALVLRLK